MGFFLFFSPHWCWKFRKEGAKGGVLSVSPSWWCRNKGEEGEVSLSLSFLLSPFLSLCFSALTKMMEKGQNWLLGLHWKNVKTSPEKTCEVAVITGNNNHPDVWDEVFFSRVHAYHPNGHLFFSKKKNKGQKYTSIHVYICLYIYTRTYK